MEEGIRLRHRLEYLALRQASRWLGQGTVAQSYARARRLSVLGRFILRKEWAWAQANLFLVYGHALDLKQRRKLARLAFGHIFSSFMESLRQPDFDIAAQGLDDIQEALAGKRGVIICGVHLGAWEASVYWAGALQGLPVSVLYRHANNPLSEAHFQKMRESYQVEWIKRRDGRAVIKALRAGRIVIFMTDINTRQGGVAAPFLGVPAMCPPGPARLALQFGCPILGGIMVREGDGVLRGQIVGRIDPQGSKEDIPALTGQINHMFEPWIHRYAEQYNWLHARFRARPDGSLWRPQEVVAGQARVDERVRRLLEAG